MADHAKVQHLLIGKYQQCSADKHTHLQTFWYRKNVKWSFSSCSLVGTSALCGLSAIARTNRPLNQRRLKQYIGSSADRSVTQKYSKLEWWATGWYSAMRHIDKAKTAKLQHPYYQTGE
jgi:hypothetical protein